MHYVVNVVHLTLALYYIIWNVNLSVCHTLYILHGTSHNYKSDSIGLRVTQTLQLEKSD